LHREASTFLYHLKSEIRAKQLALSAPAALFGMSDDHGAKSFFRDFRGFLKNFFGTDFKTDVAPFTPLVVHMDARGFSSSFLFGQDRISLHPLPATAKTRSLSYR
jgi:hypothetical protein